MTVLSFVLAAMLQLSPDRDHTELASAIAHVVDESEPLFVHDDDRHKTAALLVSIAFRESSFRPRIVGDNGTSFCAFQIHRSSGGSARLNDDLEECARAGLDLVRKSLRVCPKHPMAWYASGPRGCSSDRAQRISRDRMNLAAYLVAKLRPRTIS